MRKEEARKIAIAAAMTALSIGTGMGVQRAVLPLYVSGFIGRTLSYLFIVLLPILSFGAFKGLADLLAGYLADRLGRKVAVVLGTSLFFVGTLLLIYSADLLTVAVATLVMGWSQGLVDSGVMIVLSEAGGRERHGLSLGIMEASVYGGYTAGSFLGGYISEIRNVPDAFYVTLAASALALILSVVGIGETRVETGGGEIPTLRAYSLCLRSGTLRLTYLLGHVAQFSDALIWGLLPLYLSSLGYGVAEIGFIQGLNTLSWAILMPFSGRISDVFGRRLPIFMGFSIKALSIYAMNSVRDPLLMALASITLGLGVGLYYPILPAISADAAPPAVRGRSMGLYTSFRDFGYMTGAIALGTVGEVYGFEGTFVLTALLMGLGSFLIFLMKETRPFWPAYDMVVDHASKVIRAVESFASMVSSYSRGVRDEDDFRLVKEYERQADEVRVAIDRQLWLSSLSGQDKADFARLVGRVDRIASFALGASRRLRTLDPEDIPPRIRELMGEMAKVSRWISNRLFRAIEVMREDIESSLEIVSEIDALESVFDELHQQAMEELLHVEMHVVKLMNLRDFVELFENMIDAVEDASDVLRVIAFKHMAWPV